MRKSIYLFILLFMFSFFNVGLSSDLPMKNVKIKIHEFDGVRYISGLEFAETQNIARQIVLHGKFALNGVIQNDPNISVLPGDRVIPSSIKEAALS